LRYDWGWKCKPTQGKLGVDRQPARGIAVAWQLDGEFHPLAALDFDITCPIAADMAFQREKLVCFGGWRGCLTMRISKNEKMKNEKRRLRCLQ
jgi:hypothetical protein